MEKRYLSHFNILFVYCMSIFSLCAISISCKNNNCKDLISDKGWNEYWEKLKPAEQQIIIDRIKVIASKTIKENPGKGIKWEEARVLTSNFVSAVATGGNNDILPKSVYFELTSLQSFLGNIEKKFMTEAAFKCTEEPKEKGVRLYFGKTEGSDSHKGPTSVIFRLTCNRNDLDHTDANDDAGMFIAYDFGDVCPPVCKDKNVTSKKGNYIKTGSPEVSTE